MPDFNSLNSIKSKIKAEDEKKIRGLSFAKLYYANKDYEKALAYLNEYITVKNNNAEAYKTLGDIYEALNNNEKAFEAYKKSYYIDKNQDSLLFKICEKLEVLNTDSQTYKLWLERLERKYPQHQSVFILKDKLQLENHNNSGQFENTFRDLSNIKISDLTDDKCSNLSSSFLVNTPNLSSNQIKLIERSQDRIFKKITEMEDNFTKKSNELIELVKENQTKFNQLKNDVESINTAIARLQIGQQEIKDSINDFISGANYDEENDDYEDETENENESTNNNQSNLQQNLSSNENSVFARLGPNLSGSSLPQPVFGQQQIQQPIFGKQPQLNQQPIQQAPTNQTIVQQNSQSGFSDFVKNQNQGKWTCDGCYMKNDMSLSICPSCESPNPANPPAPSVPKPNITNPLANLSISTPSNKSAFTLPPQFQQQTQPTDTKFVFGLPASTQPSTNLTNEPFKFNLSNSSIVNQPAVQPLQSNIQQSPFQTSIFKPQIPSQNQPLNPVAKLAQSSPFNFANSSPNSSFVFGNQNISNTLNISSTPSFPSFSLNNSTISSTTLVKPPSTEKKIVEDQASENVDVEEEQQCDFKPVIPLPPKIDVVTGEEGEKVLFSGRAKLYRFTDNEWKERGIGDIKLLHDENKNKYRLLMRRDQILKVCLNSPITNQFKFEDGTNKTGTLAKFGCFDFSDEVSKPEVLTIKFKTKEILENFKKEVQKVVSILNGEKPIEKKIEKPQEDEDLKVIYVKEPKSNSDKEKAIQLKLPINFFSYIDAKPCPGCNGCKEYIPKLRYETKTENDEKSENDAKENQATINSENLFSAAILKSGTVSSTWAKSTEQPKWMNSANQPLFSKKTTEQSDDPETEVDNFNYKPVIPMPDLVDVKTGEEEEEVLFSNRAKLFKYVNSEWKERGVGVFKILKHPQTNKIRFLMRRDQVHKICLNHLVDKNLKIALRPERETIYQWFTADFSEGISEPSMFNLKFKNKEIANEFIQALRKHVDGFQG